MGVLQQHTLRQPARYSGIGLHSGNKVSLAVLPAPPDSGVRFRRVDLEGKPEIEARVENVTETNRSTTISKGNAKIHTVEHVLAALAGAGVDNAVIELDSNEPPIADGSSREFVRIIREAGLEAQAERREVFAVHTAIEFELGDSLMSIFPSDRLRVSCTSSDKRGRFTQHASLEITPESWETEISPARTFCFYEEIEYLIKNGLIRGGSLENAVVIRDDAVLTTEPLRFSNEFARHKILDIFGDLSLVGRPVTGHIIAIKPSHAANCELSRQIVAQMRRPLTSAQTFAPPPAVTPEALVQPEAALDIMKLMRMLPHRYPFLMVDRVLSAQAGKIVALKNVTINEPFFQGHFPGHPIMPGVLQLEAMAQVAGILTLQQAENLGKIAYFMSAERVKWRKPVRPGDTLIIEVELTKSRGKIGRATGVCKVGSEVVSEAEVTFMMVDP
jgi:UDP-3-O-[3-hydroxymyristoyl] N-acetylglucosamine deacetylase/3-hydroxyacyl-[acyl-carrier-protein] dehydratase